MLLPQCEAARKLSNTVSLLYLKTDVRYFPPCSAEHVGGRLNGLRREDKLYDR
jgi:hypothetical protein